MGLVHVDGCHGISEFLNIRPRPGQGQGAGPGEKGALWGKIVPSMTIATIASSPGKARAAAGGQGSRGVDGGAATVVATGHGSSTSTSTNTNTNANTADDSPVQSVLLKRSWPPCALWALHYEPKNQRTMVKLMMWTVPLLGCALLVLVRGEGTLPEESCATPNSDVPEDEFALCNVGSACREDLHLAGGNTGDMWADETMTVRTGRYRSEKNRLKLNQYQPALVPRYTEVGYKKEKLNPETYAYLMEWYNKAARSRTSEKWAEDNVYVNHWKVDTIMVHAPPRVVKRLYDDLAHVMEDWAGMKLKRTSCYGVRLYFRGSVLANHVDRVDTHVISAIINVAQEGVDTDWPLYVRGHDGVAKNITMEPGEIILYESASVIHGRPTAFQGESYANIFVHYSPVEGYTVTNRQVQQAAADAARKGRTEKKTAMAK
eukprot:jgi/Undpi1/7884/HiC_scaffold_24.g10356.m1